MECALAIEPDQIPARQQLQLGIFRSISAVSASVNSPLSVSRSNRGRPVSGCAQAKLPCAQQRGSLPDTLKGLATKKEHKVGDSMMAAGMM